MSSLKKAQFVEGRVDLIRDAVYQVVQLAVLRQVFADIVNERFYLRQVLDRISR